MELLFSNKKKYEYMLQVDEAWKHYKVKGLHITWLHLY